MSIPIGKDFALLTKYYIGIVARALTSIEIERYFYPIVLIKESETPLCQNDLAEGMGTDKVMAVRIVDYLSEKGFIKRVKSKTDRRYYHLVLTPKGRKVYPKVKAAFETANAICFKGFKKSEREEFQRLLLKLHNNLQAHPREEVKLNYNKIK